MAERVKPRFEPWPERIVEVIVEPAIDHKTVILTFASLSEKITHRKVWLTKHRASTTWKAEGFP